MFPVQDGVVRTSNVTCNTKCLIIQLMKTDSTVVGTLLLSVTQPFCLCNVSGTDVMLLDNFSTDGSSQPQSHGNPSGKRRSSVTFEDQVEHSKGICHFPTRKRKRLEGREQTSCSLSVWEKSLTHIRYVHRSICLIRLTAFFSAAENTNTSSVQVHAEVHKSLDTFASCLAKAIESDAKLTLFGDGLALPGGLFTTRAAPRPRYLDGQRLRLESIDEGIVKDDRDEEEQDVEEKPAWTQPTRFMSSLSLFVDCEGFTPVTCKHFYMNCDHSSRSVVQFTKSDFYTLGYLKWLGNKKCTLFIPLCWTKCTTSMSLQASV